MYATADKAVTIEQLTDTICCFSHQFPYKNELTSRLDLLPQPVFKQKLGDEWCRSFKDTMSFLSPQHQHQLKNSDGTRSSAIAEGPRDASCQLKSWQLPRNSAETTYTTSPDQIDGMKLEI